MERSETAETDLFGLAQPDINLIEASRRILLRESPAKLDLTKGMPKSKRHFFAKAKQLARADFDPVWPTQPDVRVQDTIAQREASCVGVIDLAGQTQTILALLGSLVGKA
jgi:hypothetical protein